MSNALRINTINKLREIWSYAHNVQDIIALASGTGMISMYHGCPLPFAQSIVEHGPRKYTVYGLARHVAVIYGLNWSQFKHFAYRKHEKFERLSTATAPVSARWAWTFKLGEVLTDLNSHARLVVEANRISREHNISFGLAYEDLYNKAVSIGRAVGTIASSEAAPDILGLEDRLALPTSEGAIVQVRLNIKSISSSIIHDAGITLKYIDKEGVKSSLLAWNESYFDLKVRSEDIISSRIAVRGLYKDQSVEYERMIADKTLTHDEIFSWIKS